MEGIKVSFKDIGGIKELPTTLEELKELLNTFPENLDDQEKLINIIKAVKIYLLSF